MDRYLIFLGACVATAMALLPNHAHAQATNPKGPAVGLATARVPAGPELFGTVPVRIAGARFSEEWERARRDSTSPRMRALIRPALNVTREQQIAYVQKAVSRLIGWRSDATQWGRHDYWASADETLSRRLGDSEDRAIVKMQALRALGFSRGDLFLTLGRDTVAGPQPLLIVRHRNRYLVLDDNGTPPFTPERRPEFTPALTFAFGSVWAHVSEGKRGGVGSVSLAANQK